MWQRIEYFSKINLDNIHPGIAISNWYDTVKKIVELLQQLELGINSNYRGLNVPESISVTELYQFGDAASKASWTVVDRGREITFFEKVNGTGNFLLLWSDIVVKVNLKKE